MATPLVRACDRCGFERQCDPEAEFNLCKSCTSVLTPKQRQVWKMEKK